MKPEERMISQRGLTDPVVMTTPQLFTINNIAMFAANKPKEEREGFDGGSIQYVNPAFFKDADPNGMHIVMTEIQLGEDHWRLVIFAKLIDDERPHTIFVDVESPMLEALDDLRLERGPRLRNRAWLRLREALSGKGGA